MIKDFFFYRPEASNNSHKPFHS